MILTDIPSGTVFYRGHDPKWAIAPTSGAGAAKAGGRFNRPGIGALYLALEDLTALREYQQTSALLPPVTLCSYRVTMSGLVDLRLLHKGSPWDDLWHDWAEDWRHQIFDLHVEPASWVLSDLVRAAGLRGIIFPSIANPGGANMVVYPDLYGPTDGVVVIDLAHQLPKDQSSWTL